MDSRSDHGNVLGRCLRIRTFGVTIHDVAAIDTWLEEIATQWSLNETVAFKARVCIAELAANVLEHGIAKSDDDCIVVTVDRLEDEIQVEFVELAACLRSNGQCNHKKPCAKQWRRSGPRAPPSLCL